MNVLHDKSNNKYISISNLKLRSAPLVKSHLNKFCLWHIFRRVILLTTDAFRLFLSAVLISNAECFFDDYRDEVFDLRDDNFVRRQTWYKFQTKHIVVAGSIIRNANHWIDLAKDRLGSSYGPSRPAQTFIRVSNLNEISSAYQGYLQVCSFNSNSLRCCIIFNTKTGCGYNDVT